MSTLCNMQRNIAVEDSCRICSEVDGHAGFLNCISGEKKWNILVCTNLDVTICSCCWNDGRSSGSDMVPIPKFEDIFAWPHQDGSMITI